MLTNNIPPPLLIKNMTYYSSKDIESICQINKKIYGICTNSKYEIYWKNLINNTYNGNRYYELIKKENKDLKYDYRLYNKLVNWLPYNIQLKIFERTGDKESYHKIKKLEKQLSAAVSTNTSYHITTETLEQFSKLLGEGSIRRGQRGLEIAVENDTNLHAYKSKLANYFPNDQRFIMIGYDNDSLVQKYRMFTIPLSLRYLILYISDGTLRYENNEWKIYTKREEDKKWIRDNLSLLNNNK